jgi:UDP-GlcNAc3NAcA epimerase
MRLCSIVGARPQFIKLAVVCRALGGRGDGPWQHRIVHTGQHYDPGMSAVFFEELEIPRPDYDLEAGSGSHGAQTGEMLKRLEPVLEAEKPDWVLLYGDTNSTLAGALAASKMAIPLAHIESGLRSRRRSMPEEINRIVADHLSDLLFCPTALAMENLRREGLAERAIFTGDVMYDACLAFRQKAESRGGTLAERWLPGRFALATVHRAENTDDPARLREVVAALDCVARTAACPVVWPVHPRTARRLEELDCVPEAVTTIAPVSYLDMLLLEGRARFILTDSGGVQKEAYFLKTPCITLREETEWEETLENGCNRLAGCSKERILDALNSIGMAGPWTAVYGHGHAGPAILNALWCTLTARQTLSSKREAPGLP